MLECYSKYDNSEACQACEYREYCRDSKEAEKISDCLQYNDKLEAEQIDYNIFNNSAMSIILNQIFVECLPHRVDYKFNSIKYLSILFKLSGLNYSQIASILDTNVTYVNRYCNSINSNDLRKVVVNNKYIYFPTFFESATKYLGQDKSK